MSKILIFISLILILFNQVIKLSANDDTYINSSNIIYNEKDNVIELSENSKINYKNTNILIDKGIIDYNNNNFEVFGNFYLYEGLTILSGKNLVGNNSLDIFSAEEVNYLYNDDLKIDSSNLRRENNILFFYDNFLTPCELDGFFNCPTWSLKIDKTKYNIKEDKFTHFDSFLQLADYKIFYIPYFTHYGAKAPRKKGFLTPSFEFTVGGDNGLITPYYLPLNLGTDITFKPRISLNQNFEFLDTYQLDTFFENKKSGGKTTLIINNTKYSGNDDINTSLKINTEQVINENTKFTALGSFTNSISTKRSINNEPITFEDIYLRVENYNFFGTDDYLRTEISSVETFDTTNLNHVPIAPRLYYYNSLDKNVFSINNEIDFTVLKRGESTSINPSEAFKINLNSSLINSYINKNFITYNKIISKNSISDYYFNQNTSLDHKSFKNFITFSSDVYFKNINSFTPRIKYILPIQIFNSNKNLNEDSKSLTFGYQNQFSENRFFGNDLIDSSPRLVYGLEKEIDLTNSLLEIKFNQSYDANLNTSYLRAINQKTKFSDFATEAKLDMKNFLIKIDSRLDQQNFSKKEMNYSIEVIDPINLLINYNETQSDAFKEFSNDTRSISFSLSKKINSNLNLNYSSNFDVKNNYDPYKNILNLSFFDECSQLDLTYSNTRFNDNFNTQPEETIGIILSLDYLGFFKYEQSTDLFFSEPGTVNYGF